MHQLSRTGSTNELALPAGPVKHLKRLTGGLLFHRAQRKRQLACVGNAAELVLASQR